MAITFRCACGKVMQAREENAGSRCKCVGCGAVLVIPQPMGAPAPSPSAPSASAPSASTPSSTAGPAVSGLPVTSAPRAAGVLTPANAPTVATPPSAPGAAELDAFKTLPYAPASEPPQKPSAPSSPAAQQTSANQPAAKEQPSGQEKSAEMQDPSQAVSFSAPLPPMPTPAPKLGNSPFGLPGLAAPSPGTAGAGVPGAGFTPPPLPTPPPVPEEAAGASLQGTPVLAPPAPTPWTLRMEGGVPWYLRDPRKDRQRRRRRNLLLGGLAGLLVAGLAVGIWMLLASLNRPPASGDTPRKEDPAAELPQFQIVPRDAALVVTVRVSDLWASKAFEKSRLETAPAVERYFEKDLGIRPDELERITFVLPDFPDLAARAGEVPFWVIFHTKSAMDRTQIKARLTPLGTEKKVGDRVLYTQFDAEIYFPSDRELWGGSSGVIEAILKKERKIAKEGPLKEALEAASHKKYHVVAALNLAGNFKDAAAKAPMFPENLRFLLDMTGAYLAFDADNDASGDLVARLQFTNAKSAADGDFMVRFGISTLKEELNRNPSPDAATKKLQDLTLELLNLAKIAQKEGEVTITVPGMRDRLGPLLSAILPVLERGPAPAPIP